MYNMLHYIDPNKVLILTIKELVLSTYYKYDALLINQRKNNSYYDKIIR
jgi:hypothetical protein